MANSSARSPAHGSFPTPLSASGSLRAPSIISSRMTDIASEDGDQLPNDAATAGIRPTTAASNDPNRPASAMSAQTRPSTRAPPSRRGIAASGPLGGLRAGGNLNGAGASIANSSRPASSMSKTSRTHVPSLASQAFFRPMSSQRLQAQRGARPFGGNSAPSGDGTNSIGTNTNRHSLATTTTEQQEMSNFQENDIAPPSRGTEFTEQEDRATATASPTENATLQSMGDSERPLQYHASETNAQHSSPDQQGNGLPPKPSRSFGANFMKRNGPVYIDSRGHERLSSSNNSQNISKNSGATVSTPGVNYQYFSGNTVFLWGGRLQNTKDRPINILSGLIVLVPSIIFLAYS